MSSTIADVGGRRRPWLSWLTVLGFLGVVLMNYLAVSLPLAGRTTGEVSNEFPISVTPADYAFSIWSVIYFALAAFVLFQALPNQASTRFDRIRFLFLLSCVFNVAWLVAWHNLLVPLSLVLMLCLLVSLILIYREARTVAGGRAGFWFLRLPFTLYLGWISAATLVNVGVLLYDLGLLQSGPFDLTWTVLSLVLLCAAVWWVLRHENDPVYGLVALWAVAAILVANLGVPVLVVAAAAAILLIGVALVVFGRPGRAMFTS